MAAEGRTVIFISHKFHEVKAVSDNVTVLRAGKTVATPERPRARPPSRWSGSRTSARSADATR
jgi:simple sugar transport system ATP-binding protein